MVAKGKSPIEAARALAPQYVVEGRLRNIWVRDFASPRNLSMPELAITFGPTGMIGMLGDIFAIQDHVVAAIVAMLEGRMAASEAAAARTKPTTSWSAYDCLLQGRDLCDHQREPEAVPLLERAIAIDPHFALAHAWLAIALTINNVVLLDGNQMARADSASMRALELDAK